MSPDNMISLAEQAGKIAALTAAKSAYIAYRKTLSADVKTAKNKAKMRMIVKAQLKAFRKQIGL